MRRNNLNLWSALTLIATDMTASYVRRHKATRILLRLGADVDVLRSRIESAGRAWAKGR